MEINFNKIKNNIKKNLTNYLLVFVMLLLLLGFFGKVGQKDYILSSPPRNVAFDGVASSYENSYSKNNLVYTQNYNLNLESNDIFNNFNQIDSIAQSLGATLSNKRFAQNKFGTDYYLTYKIKDDEVENFFIMVEKLNLEIIRKNTQKNEVSKQISYNEKQIKSFEKQIKSYKKILNEENTNSNKFEIIKEINRLEKIIEDYNNNLNLIDEKVKYSDVYVSLSQKTNPIKNIDFSFSSTITNFLTSLIQSFNFIFVLLGYIIPFAIIYFIYRKLKVYFKNKF